MKIAHVIPYQGSKRNIAKYILCFFFHQVKSLIEPFAGSGAVSVAAACMGKASKFHLNDINQPLMTLWGEIIENPKRISDAYERLWNEQKEREREYYDRIRDKFNKTKKPEYLLYLLARCVKAAIRYNLNGEFNQSPDNRRKGKKPKNMKDDIFAMSHLLRERTILTSKDYKEIFESISKKDLVYMDPPYQGVCTKRDSRYFNGIDFNELISELEGLNRKDIPFILSYDGRSGKKIYGKELPKTLGLYRIEVMAGRSTQSTLLGKKDITYESIYLSGPLIDRLEVTPDKIAEKFFPKTYMYLGPFEEKDD